MYNLRISPSHFDRERVVVILLGLPTGGVLGEKCISYHLVIVERMRRQRIKTNLRPCLSYWMERSGT